jgi:Zn-finger protein
MKHSHRFFQNTQCEYFPCHDQPETDRFNCLFCFCPLYFLEECGGDYRTVGGVKDCSPCSRPHRPENYDEIVNALRREIQRRQKLGDWSGGE